MYDWPKYQETGILEKTSKTYIIEDTEVLAGGRWFPVDWKNLSGTAQIKQFFYRVCFDFRSSKTAKNIKEVLSD